MQRALFLGSIAALFLVQIYLRFQSDIIQDCAWFLYVAEQLLKGKTLYADIKEVNPPLGMWMIVPIVWAAKLFAVNAVSATYIALLAMSAGTIGLCNRYIRINGDLETTPRCILTFCVALAVLFFPAAFFAEREHFIVLLFLPWVFLRCISKDARNISTWERILIGAMAGLSICIKPQALFAPALLEFVLASREARLKRIWAPENISAVITSAIYAISIFIFAPLFITEMLNLGAKAYVPFYGYPSYMIALNARSTIIALIILFVIRMRLKTLNAETPVIDAIMATAIGFLASYFIQMKGFTYQIMPANILAWLGCAAAAAQLWKIESKLSLHVAAAIAVGALMLNDVPQTYFNPYKSVSEALAKNAPNARSIFIASTRLDDGFPLVQKHNLVWASRLPTQWLTPYVASKWQGAALPQDDIVSKALDWTVTDLQEMKPDIVMIDLSNDQVYVPGGKFDYIKFWQNDPRFQTLWAQYEYRETVRELAIYTLRQK